jgi:hypothetical protein
MTLSTLEFLRLVVPEQGYKFISTDPGKGGWRDRCVGRTHEEMATAIEHFSNHPVNIYHANGGFIDSQARKAERATHFRALWLDLDVQKTTGDSYDSIEEAVAAAKQFLRAAGLPKPSLLVRSGMGVHIYWCFDEDVEASRWLAMAEALKQLVITHDLVADMSVISDMARVLRPIGTTWRDVKRFSGKTLPVTLGYANPDSWTYPVNTLEERLQTAPARPRIDVDLSINDTLGSSATESYEGCDPLRIAESCGQMKRFQQSGHIEYKTWFNLLGVLARCGEKGHEYAHKWSQNGFADYDPTEVNNKLESWSAPGGTRCSTFRKDDPNGPCSTCKVVCNSPMALGYGGGARPVVFTNEARKPEIFIPVAFPDGARIHNDGHLELEIHPKPTNANPEPIPVWIKVCSLPFYFESIAVDQDGSQESDVVFFPRQGEIKRFVMPHAVAQNARELKRVLNNQGLFADQHIEKYVVSYLELLKKHVQDTPTRSQMGWIGKRDEFLIGDQMITPDGVAQVRVNAHLRPKAQLFDATNKPEQWVSAVDELYNLPGGEPYQFAIAAAFASPLIPILGAEEFNGIPVALTSDESGYGKSTVCKIALSAFGRVERNLNVLTGDEVSSGAVEVQCSTFNCVPHLFDEMTNKSGQDTSHILYMLSNGVARARLKQDGTPRPASPPWQGIAFITGNKNIFLKLTESRVNPEAAQMRVFEIPLESYGKVDSLLHASDFIELTNSIRSGYGAVGVEYLRYVMKKRDKVHRDMWALVNMISKSKGVRHDKERFYIYEIAAICTAVRIMRKLGIVKFDTERLYRWSMDHLASMRDSASEYQRSAGEDFAMMLATLVGQGKVIATAFSGDRNDNDLILRSAPVMRICRDTRSVFLTQRGFFEYCRDVSKNPTKFRQELADADCLDPELTDYVLGQGVKGLTLGTSKCYRLDFEKANGPVSASIGSADRKVVSIHQKKEAQ